ncbi:MAG: DNA-directed RNA polymerase specialized sigma24 family protein [Candidatus Azotimanducaceae bacterium]|jgi:DNA-directed RNA polymerase specialized sigma24 family protein|tara:strand:- start:4652 stop:5233 length:582 start_codon:yes stop_codon:yes gene_type:complete
MAARLYDKHVGAVYSYAARRVGRDAAVTVVKDVFEHALGQQARRPEKASSDLGWLLAITTAFLRRHSATECGRLLNWTDEHATGSGSIPRVTDPLLSSDADDAAVASTAKVMAAVAELEPEDRDLLFLVAWEGCSSALVSAATGIPQGNVRSRLSAVRKELRRRVGDTANETETDETDERPTEPVDDEAEDLS